MQILGMVPDSMLQRADEQHRTQFFEQIDGRWTIKQVSDNSNARPSSPIVPSENPIESLMTVVEKEAARKKKYSSSDEGHSRRQYDLFVDMIFKMLDFSPTERITPADALQHPFITERSS